LRGRGPGLGTSPGASRLSPNATRLSPGAAAEPEGQNHLLLRPVPELPLQRRRRRPGAGDSEGTEGEVAPRWPRADLVPVVPVVPKAFVVLSDLLLVLGPSGTRGAGAALAPLRLVPDVELRSQLAAVLLDHVFSPGDRDGDGEVPNASPTRPQGGPGEHQVAPVLVRWPQSGPGGPDGPRVAPGHLRADPGSLKMSLAWLWWLGDVPSCPQGVSYVPRVSSCVPKVVPRWPWWSPGGPSGPKVAPGHLRAVPGGLKVFLTCPW